MIFLIASKLNQYCCNHIASIAIEIILIIQETTNEKSSPASIFVENNETDNNSDLVAQHPDTKTKVSTINDAIVINAKTAKNDTIGNLSFHLLNRANSVF